MHSRIISTASCDAFAELPLPDVDDSIEEVSPYLRKVALVSGLAALLCGFDTGIISSVLISVGSEIENQPLSTGEAELVVTSVSISALFGSLLAGYISDRYGRRSVLLISAVLFTLGAIEQSAAHVLKELVLGRLIVGLAAGLAASINPVYLAEMTPPKLRGRLVTSQVILITFGQVLAYIVGAIFFTVPHGFRWMFLSAILLSIPQFCLTFTIQESPRWLIRMNRTMDARACLAKVYPTLSATDIEGIVSKIALTLDEGSEATSSFRQVQAKLWNDLPSRRALIVACGLQLFQQATGFNSLMYYSGQILQAAGFSHPPLFAIFVAFSNWICTMIALTFIDKVGRKKLLSNAVLGMIFGSFFMGLFFLFIPMRRGDSDLPADAHLTAVGGLALVSMIFFCCSYALGLGNVPWILQSEMFAYDVRALAGGIATGINWIANMLISATFLHLIQAITIAGAFWLYCGMTVLCWLFVHFRVRETAGLSLEETRHLFEDDTGKGKFVGEEDVALMNGHREPN